MNKVRNLKENSHKLRYAKLATVGTTPSRGENTSENANFYPDELPDGYTISDIVAESHTHIGNRLDGLSRVDVDFALDNKIDVYVINRKGTIFYGNHNLGVGLRFASYYITIENKQYFGYGTLYFKKP